MKQLEFIDCRSCGKRLARSATICHHCKGVQKDFENPLDEEGAESHFASEFGGYDSSQDDFDYDEFLLEEFADGQPIIRNRNRWKYVSILLLVVFAFLFFVQLL